MAGRLTAFVFVVSIALLAVAGTWLTNRANDIAEGVQALLDREFAAFTVITVGTGGAYENHRRRGPCIAVGRETTVVLVDAGRGVAEGLRASAIPVSQPGTVYLTSLLPENTVGLDDLLATGGLGPRTAPLRLVGPPGTAALAAGIAAAHAEAFAARVQTLGLPAAAFRLEAIEVGEGWSERIGPLSVRAAAVPGGPLPSLAWRFEADGRAVVVSGSGPPSDAVAALARGAQVLVHEGTFTESVELAIEAGAEDPERLRREVAQHTSLRDAGRLARTAGVELLVLVRMRPPPLFDRQATSLVAKTFGGDAKVADDGDEITP